MVTLCEVLGNYHLPRHCHRPSPHSKDLAQEQNDSASFSEVYDIW